MSPMKPAFAALAGILAFTLVTPARPASASQAGPSGSSRVITMVNLQASLAKTIDAKKSKAGDPVVAKVTAAAVLSDGTRVPSGSLLEGHIDSITPSENKGDSTLVLTIDKLQIKNGKEVVIKATFVQVASVAPVYGQDKDTPDPSAYLPGTVGNSGLNSSSAAQGLHAIDGLTLTGSPRDATTATLTQSKKNLHLPEGVLLLVSVAAMPSGVTVPGGAAQ